MSGSGINEVVHLLSRGRELAVQSANATQDSQTRTAMQKLSETLTQIDNIANTTTYNGKKIFGNWNLKFLNSTYTIKWGFLSADGQTTVDNNVQTSTSSSVSSSDIAM